MERRDFLQTTSLLAACGLLPGAALQAWSGNQLPPAGDSLQPFLLAPSEALSDKGSMDIRVWVRSAMTGGVYACVECALAPKEMGPPPHLHKEM